MTDLLLHIYKLYLTLELYVLSTLTFIFSWIFRLTHIPDGHDFSYVTKIMTPSPRNFTCAGHTYALGLPTKNMVFHGEEIWVHHKCSGNTYHFTSDTLPEDWNSWMIKIANENPYMDDLD